MTPAERSAKYGAFRVAYQTGRCHYGCGNRVTDKCRECGYLCALHARRHNSTIEEVFRTESLSIQHAILATPEFDLVVQYCGEDKHWSESEATAQASAYASKYTVWVEHQDPDTKEWRRW